MSITNKHTWGWNMEKILHPYLEEVLEEPLVKSSGRFDVIDFVGSHWMAELKCRPSISERGKPQNSDSFSTWYLPTSKESIDIPGELCFFYYWEQDNSLWYIIYDKELFASFMKEKLWFHPTRQEHWYVPKSAFTKLDTIVVKD